MYARFFFLILLFVSMSAFLYTTKYTYISFERDYKSVTNSIKENKESIHVLLAEIAHLNHPKNIEELSKRHLNMIPIKRSSTKNFLKDEAKNDNIFKLDEERQKKSKIEDSLDKFFKEQV